VTVIPGPSDDFRIRFGGFGDLMGCRQEQAQVNPAKLVNRE
jgi:hypothetical protein